MKNYILIGLAVLLGGVAGYFIRQPKHTVEYIPSKETVTFRDTCIGLNLIADITTETSTQVYHNVRKGGKTTTEESTAHVAEVSIKDSLVETVFKKDYNFGLVRFSVTNTVKASSAATGKISVSYELDTLELAKITNVTNTVVVTKDTTDQVAKEVVKYLEIPSTKKTTYLGIGGLVGKNSKTFDYSLGLSLSHGKTSVSLFKQPTTPLKSLDGYSIGINRQLIRMSAK